MKCEQNTTDHKAYVTTLAECAAALAVVIETHQAVAIATPAGKQTVDENIKKIQVRERKSNIQHMYYQHCVILDAFTTTLTFYYDQSFREALLGECIHFQYLAFGCRYN